MSIEGEQTAQFYQAMKLRLNKCLDLTMKCPNDAIRAHSVQNATALSFLVEAGHVSELRTKIENDEAVCKFQKVGRNNASTFTGLCGPHDTEIFRPIDTKPFDINDAEQLFLIAYRSITRELHVTMEAAIKIQTVFQQAVAAGKVPNDKPSPPMIAATKAMYKSWLVYRYRFQHFDSGLMKGKFNDILHSTFVVKGRRPVLAASSFFPDSDSKDPKKMTRIALNIIPLSGDETVVIFSYPKFQSAIARKRIASIILKSGDAQLLALSTLVLDATENFFVRTSHVLNWTDAKRDLIEKSFLSTVSEGAHLKQTADFMLF